MSVNHNLNGNSPGSALDEVEPPAKRHKTQACLRCRKRKQKCDSRRPCSNCKRSSQSCVEAPPPAYVEAPFAMPLPGYATQDPLAHLADIASLEERITRLEENTIAEPSPMLRQNEQSGFLDITAPGFGQNGRIETPVDSGLSVINQSLPTIGLLSAFASSMDDTVQPLNIQENGAAEYDDFLPDTRTGLSISTRKTLWDTYKEKVQCQYPFLRLEQLRDVDGRPKDISSAFFVNLIYSIGLLLLDKNSHTLLSQHHHQDHYRVGVTRYLSHVFAQPDRLLHIQAYLLLAMHAMYSPSTERIISIASATMRYCVMAQLHSVAAEPEATNSAAKVDIQLRRRVFWSAYALDRTVGAMFDLPLSIPDAQITVKMYANINEDELEARCDEAYPEDPPSMLGFTNVSAALHVVYCRQIQSEILNTTLHRDFSKYLDKHHHWRLKVLEKLDRWRSLCHRYTALHSANFSNSEWLHMIYNYSLAMLYIPTKLTVTEEAGEWAVKACTQACLIFRKFQREKPTTELWLGLIAQFKCGVTLLYCFFATPPSLRSQAYKIPEVFEAVRACSITLALLAERWPQSKCIRDSFDILAREIPLYEHNSGSGEIARNRMRRDAAESLLALLPRLELIVVHRNTLRMIREMASEEFPHRASQHSNAVEEDAALEEVIADGAEDSYSWRTGMTEDFFQPFTPHYTQLDLRNAYQDGSDDANIGFPGDFDVSPSF